MAKSTTKKSAKAARPKTPYPGFELGPHPLGYWQKRIRGRLYYFGRWGVRNKKTGKMEVLPNGGEWQKARDLYLAQAPYLHAGKVPPLLGASDELTVKDLVNRFLTAKQKLVEKGKRSACTLEDYKKTGERVADFFGKTRVVSDIRATDFTDYLHNFPDSWNDTSAGNEITRTKAIFNWAYKSELIDKPLRFGIEFVKSDPGAGVDKMFEADEIRAMLAVASVPLRAMILLGVNCGFGNNDVAQLAQSIVDLDNGVIVYPREKTKVPRKCTLWPETVEALRLAIAERPEHSDKADADCVFITKYGSRWVKGTDNAVTGEFNKVMKKAKVKVTKGRSFYGLRHTHRTIADDCLDDKACKVLMGHKFSGMDATYVNRFKVERLRAVTDHIHAWLFAASDVEGGVV